MTRLVTKALLVSGCIAAAAASCYFASVQSFLVSSPQLIGVLSPSEPRLLVRMADGLFALDQQRLIEAQQKGEPLEIEGTGARQEALALRALRQQALLPAALRQLGLARDRGRVDPASRPYLELVQRLSRRERVAQLWLAQDALKANRLDRAVGHLDTVFRTSPEAYDLIWPILLQAGEVPGLGTALARRSDMGAAWVGSYLRFLLDRNAGLGTLAEATGAIRRPTRLYYGSDIAAETVLQLMLDGQARRANTLFNQARRSGLLSAPTQSYAGESATALPWTLFGSAEAASEWRGTGRSSRKLDVLVEAGNRGAVARQVRFEQPGSYRWNASLDSPMLPPGARIEITFDCPGGAPPMVVWSARAGADEAQPVITNRAFSIGRDCPAQTFAIELIGAKDAGDATASFARLRFEKATGR